MIHANCRALDIGEFLEAWFDVAMTSDGCKTPCSRRACSPFPAVAKKTAGKPAGYTAAKSLSKSLGSPD